MSSLSDLIARVEKASGASREIDALIFCTMSGCYDWKYAVEHCDAYTASIDAALTLVPEGMGFNLQGNTNLFYAVVAGQYSKPTTTPALALVAACLKARLLDAASSEAADQ